MAIIQYNGKSYIRWGPGWADSIQTILYNRLTDELHIWPLQSAPMSAPHPPEAWQEYVGPLDKHPAKFIEFYP